jgi:hypothetical protein
MSEQEDHRRHGHPGNEGSEDDPITKTKSLAELALVYIGIPGATLYPLGLVALLIQVWQDPSFPYIDPTTAWTAVSLIPQTVVIGTGIGLIFLSLFAALLGMEVYFLTFILLHKWHKGRSNSSPEDLRYREESRRACGGGVSTCYPCCRWRYSQAWVMWISTNRKLSFMVWGSSYFRVGEELWPDT